MAINVDISKITGINQVGNSYQRKSAVPLDYYSLFNTKAEAEAYAQSNPVSYVGQVISYIHEGEVKVCVIANAAGSLKEVGTKPVGDGKTIEVSAEGAVALLGSATASNGTLPMLEEVDGKQKLVWKTLEDIGAGDGNDNTTYEFAFAEQKITITPKFNGQPIMEGEGEEAKQVIYTLDLTAFVTSEELETRLAQLPADENTTYSLTQEGMVLTLTPSEGEADVVTIDAYNKKEIDDKFAALPEDKDTTYTAKADDKVLKLTGTEFSTEISLKHENGRISLTGKDGVEIAGFSDAEFVEDGVLQDVSYNAETRELTFTWNIITGSDEQGNVVYKTDVVNIADLVDTYTAGNGLQLTDNAFSVKVAEGNESFLSVDANGVKLSGVQEAINAAKQAAIDDAKQYAVATSVYTKEEANALLADKADKSNVYTKSEADALINVKANSDDVYTKTEANNLLATKANTSDVYTKSETYTQKQVDDLLEGIQAGSSESAASVNTKLEALKKTLNTEIYGNEEGTGDSRIDTAEAKLATVAEGAQVNVIESVVVDNGTGEAIPTAKLTATKNGKTITLDDSALQAAIKDAKAAGTAAAQTASEAVAAASANAQAIQKNAGDITALQTAVGTNTTDITALKAHDTEHTAQYNALNTLVGEHGTKIANLESGKADKSVVEGISGKATANEEAIKTLNETTIPTINGEIAKKADATALNDYYTKSEIDTKTGAINLAIEGNATAITEITKENGTIDTKVKALADGAVAENTAAIKALNETTIPAINKAIEDEAKRADTAEKANAAAIAALIGTVEGDNTKSVRNIAKEEVALIVGAAPEAMDTLEEVAKWIADDESGAAAMVADIKANADAIDAINNPTTGAVATAKGYTDAEIAKLTNGETGILALAKAYSDANLVTAKAYSDANLATAKKYADDEIAKIHTVDGDTIKLNENKAYIAKVSTDVLVQGASELIFSAGNASGYNTTT